MSTIHYEHKHTLTTDEALQRAQTLTQEMADRVKATVTWKGPVATFKGTGFSGEARVTPGAIALDVDLSLLLRPLKSKIEEKIGSSMQKRFE